MEELVLIVLFPVNSGADVQVSKRGIYAPGTTNRIVSVKGSQTKLSYSNLCSSESNSSTPFETHLSSHKPHIFIVGTFVGAKMCLSCEEIPLLLRELRSHTH